MRNYLQKNASRLAFVAIAFVAALAGVIDLSTAALSMVVLSYETVAGSTLAVTATAPATLDLAGYSSTDNVWTTVGEITDLAGVAGRKYNTSEHAPIDSRQRKRKKASFTFEDRTFMMAWDPADAGQDLCRTASLDDSIVYFQITKQGGDKRYFSAQVSEFSEVAGTVDNVVQGRMVLLQQTDTVSDPAGA